MDLDDAKKLRSKAQQILKQFETIEALQWLMDQGKTSWVGLDFNHSAPSRDGIEKIDKGISFTHNQNLYHLIYANGRSFYVPNGDAFKGDFFLYFNNNLVLKTDYDKSTNHDYYDEFAPPVKPKITSSFESIKLDDWVEDLPKIVQVEKLKQQEKQQLKLEERNKAFSKRESDNIDLGKYGQK